MKIVTGHKVLAAIVGALVMLALCAGTAMAVTTATNNHNAAVQRAAAAAQAHRRAIRIHNLVIRRTAQRQAAALAQAERDARQAEQQARQARREARRAANRPPAVVQPAAPAAPAGLTDRGTGTNGEEVYANAPTSTPFALNVESDYWNTPGMQFTSYSPVTGQDYSMSAVDSGGEVTVTNGLGCVIQFSDS